MARAPRLILISIAVLIAVVVVAVLTIPLFLNADSFRARIDSTLSKSLGRKVTIDKVDLSLLSGGMVAHNATVADDPAFSAQPFLQADNVKIRVEILPLLLHRTLLIRGFSLQSPKIQLLRSASGIWNYSTLGRSGADASAQDHETRQTFPNLTIDKVDIEDGRILVGTASGAGAGSAPGGTGAAPTSDRVYSQVALQVKDFGLASSFPFTASANLPAGGTLTIKGKAGPIDQQDASATPFSGDLELKHIDPVAAGFVSPSAGIFGAIDSIVLDAAWTGQQMHVNKLLVASPRLTIVRSGAPSLSGNAEAKPANTSLLERLSVDDAQITNGSVTLTTAGQTAAPAVYQQLDARITNLSPGTASNFTLSAQLPGGGALNASGKAGPFDRGGQAATPVDAQVTLKHVELGSSGVLPPDAGITGATDLQARVQSNGQTLNANGDATVANIKLARDGQPSAVPLQVHFVLAQNEQAKSGQIQQATIALGRAVIRLAGTYQTAGSTTTLNLRVDGNGLPIDEIEAFLPALGVHLPQGSRLQGGSLTTSLAVSGSSAAPVLSGPVRVANTQLAGFDLGSKLQSLSALTGGKIGSATGPGTTIRSLSMQVQEAQGNLRTDQVDLDVAGVGTATGAGTVSAAGALDYNMLLKLTGLVAAPAANSASAPASNGGVAGLLGGLTGGMLKGGTGGGINLGALGGLVGGVLRSGVPVAIRGTTSNPTFSPNLGRLAGGLGGGANSR